MSITADEIGTQPALWTTAAALAGEHAELLPAPGARVCVIGCGTSLFVAQAYAALRERAGLGETDAFAASELPTGRRYDVLVAISRSGTTTEVAHALGGHDLAARSVALVAVPGTPIDVAGGATPAPRRGAPRSRRPGLRRRPLRGPAPVCHLGADAPARDRRPGGRRDRRRR